MKSFLLSHKRQIFIVAVIILILILILASFVPEKIPPASPPASAPSPVPSSQPFYPTSEPYESLYRNSNHDYEIVYFPTSDFYNIVILSSPFAKYRDLAEADFLKQRKLAKDAACQLRVQITTPLFANPDQSGRLYPLSFCPPTPTPTT